MKLKKQKSKSKGLTLIELLIVTCIVSVIILALLGLYALGQKYFLSESARADVLRDSRHVLNWVSRDIKEGIEVLSSYDTHNASDDCLILKVPSVDSSGLIIDVENDFDYIIYCLNPSYSNRLERIIDANDGVSSRNDSTRTITDKVGSLAFSSGGVALSSVSDFSQIFSVNIALTTRQTWMGKSYQETLNTLVKLRNKIYD